MSHVPFPKIHAVNKSDTDGIFDHEVIIQEKIDGANLSVWTEDGEIFVGSRTQIVGDKERKQGFRGAVEYVNAHAGVRKILEENPTFRLFGEWLVPHTLKYPDKYYNKFWLFDIMLPDGTFLNPVEVVNFANAYGINNPEIFHVGKSDPQHALSFVGRSSLFEEGELRGEGVVIKAPTFVNKYGEKTYAKIVSSNFKERNQLVFGNTHKDSEPELDFVCKYVTIPRLEKLVHKVEQVNDSDISKRDTPRIINTMWHDVFTEELWDYVKKEKPKSFDFKKAQRICTDRTKILFFDYLEGFTSVANAYQHETNLP